MFCSTNPVPSWAPPAREAPAEGLVRGAHSQIMLSNLTASFQSFRLEGPGAERTNVRARFLGGQVHQEHRGAVSTVGCERWAGPSHADGLCAV